MPITTIYEIRHNLFEWVAVIDNAEYGHSQLTAKIKAKIKNGESVEEEWAARAIIERRATEERWRGKAKDFTFHCRSPRYLR